MKTIADVFKGEFKKMSERGWTRIYVMIDIHDTIFKSTYKDPETYKWLGKSKEALQAMTQDPRIYMVLWSSVYPEKASEYTSVFWKNHIFFDNNEGKTPEPNTGLCYFGNKPYFNIILDDKSGFDPETDWEEIIEVLKEMET